MPDKRKHRGPGPKDRSLFRAELVPIFKVAVADLSWLRSRGYSEVAALKLVGDRFQFAARQRTAIARCVATDAQLIIREQREVAYSELRGAAVDIDGFNLLTSLEAALGGSVILEGRDGVFRDMASMHGSYRRVEETRPAIELLVDYFAAAEVGQVHWYLDQPVSNSGKLAGIIREVSSLNKCSWEVSLVRDPDPVLKESKNVVVSADREILDGAEKWLNTAAQVVRGRIPEAWVVSVR